mgnify:CR=1 FL=1
MCLHDQQCVNHVVSIVKNDVSLALKLCHPQAIEAREVVWQVSPSIINGSHIWAPHLLEVQRMQNGHDVVPPMSSNWARNHCKVEHYDKPKSSLFLLCIVRVQILRIETQIEWMFSLLSEERSLWNFFPQASNRYKVERCGEPKSSLFLF